MRRVEGQHNRTPAFLRDLRRAVPRHRRLLAAGLAAAAMAFALAALRPDPPPTTDVLVAVRDLAAGVHLRAGDTRSLAVPATAAPDGVLADPAAVAGRVLAAPVRRGEPLTDVRLVGAAALHGYGAGKVGTPVRLADPGVAALLRPGAVVDVLAVPTAAGLDATGPARVVARGVRVVSVGADTDPGAGAGTLVVVAATPRQAAALAKGAAGARLSVTLH